MATNNFQQHIRNAKAKSEAQQHKSAEALREHQSQEEEEKEKQRKAAEEIHSSTAHLVPAIETFLGHNPKPDTYHLAQLEDHGRAPRQKIGNVILGAISNVSFNLPYVAPKYEQPVSRGILVGRDIKQQRIWYNGNNGGILSVEYEMKGWLLGLSRYDYEFSEMPRDTMYNRTDNLGIQVFLGRQGTMLIRPTVITNAGNNPGDKLNPQYNYGEYSTDNLQTYHYSHRPRVIDYKGLPKTIDYNYLDLTRRLHTRRGGSSSYKNPIPPIPHPTVKFYDSLQGRLAEILVEQNKV